MIGVDWLWNFLLSFFAPRIANDIGPLILLIFFGMLVFGYFYVWMFIPEAKGLSLEEVRSDGSRSLIMFLTSLQVDEMYRAGIKPWQSANWRPSEKPFDHDTKEVREDQGKGGLVGA